MTEPSRAIAAPPSRLSVTEPDGHTIERCRDGDRDALRELFDAYGGRVYSIARHFFAGDDARARDITQDVFVKVMENVGTFQGTSRFSTWLHRLTVNACLDARRRDSRLVLLPNPPETPPSGDDAPQSIALDRSDTSDRVAGAMAELSPILRAVVLLRYFEEMSYDEMAEALDCAPGTIASRLNRAHAALARALVALRHAEPGR
jgi:RNA polymerase sigma-70 factor (ECF subfamily)